MKPPLFLYDSPCFFLVSLNVFQYFITKESQTRQVESECQRWPQCHKPRGKPKEGYENNEVEIHHAWCRFWLSLLKDYFQYMVPRNIQVTSPRISESSKQGLVRRCCMPRTLEHLIYIWPTERSDHLRLTWNFNPGEKNHPEITVSH